MPRGGQSDPGRFAELVFPVSGIDLSTEFQLQEGGTTPEGVNVRGFEALSMRQRGGSRAGLSRYISTPVGGLDSPVQHLAVIVDPTPRGLHAYGADYTPGGGVDLGGGLVVDTGEGTGRTPADPGTTTDPSTNNDAGGHGDRNPTGRTPRLGGGGEQTNRHLPPPPPPPPPIAFVQSKYGPVPGTYTPGLSDFGFSGGNARRTVTMDSHVTDGHLLVAVLTIASNPVTTVQVRNSALSAYTQAGTFATYVRFGQTFQLGIFYRIATGGTSEDAVLVDPVEVSALSVALLEFSDVLAPVGASLDTFAKTSDGGGGTSMTTGSVAVALPGECLVAGWTDDAQDVSAAGGTPAGYVLVVDQHDGTDMPSLYVAYKLGLSAAEAAVLTYTPNFTYDAAGATFKPA